MALHHYFAYAPSFLISNKMLKLEISHNRLDDVSAREFLKALSESVTTF